MQYRVPDGLNKSNLDKIGEDKNGVLITKKSCIENAMPAVETCWAYGYIESASFWSKSYVDSQPPEKKTSSKSREWPKDLYRWNFLLMEQNY